MKQNTIIALLGAAAAAVIATASPAAATPSQDATFLDLITSHSLGFKSADVAIAEGHAVCKVLDDGTSIPTTLAAVEQVMSLNLDQATTVVAAAMVAYCPWNVPSSGRAPSSSVV